MKSYAFPIVDELREYGGMTLLDYFAGQVLPTMFKRDVLARVLTSSNLSLHQANTAVAKKCYNIAEAMLNAREKYEK